MKLKGLLVALIVSALGFNSALAAPTNHIKDVEAVTEIFGDGENLSAVILTYDKEILAKSVSREDFEVPERTVSRVYVSKIPEKGVSALRGRYVVLELESLPPVEQMMPEHSPQDRAERESKGFHGPTLGSHGNPHPLKTFSAEVTQIDSVENIRGKIYPPSEKLSSSHTRQLIVEDFVQSVFKDPNGATLAYNLFIPKNYDPKKKYPLVLFMHDAGAVSPEVKMTLCQGKGAIVFATPEFQEKNPCFVLAPQYDTVIVDDNWQYGPELDRTIHLIEFLSGKYSIDKKRIYNTGQSMGGMTSIAMDIKYPDFFAASYLVACKWDANVTLPLGKQNIWAVAAEGDPGAMPSMAEILGNLEIEGIKVIRQTIDASQPQPEINSQVAALQKDDCHVYYTLYKGGSHRYTWQHAYDMMPALDWIFSHSLSD